MLTAALVLAETPMRQQVLALEALAVARVMAVMALVQPVTAAVLMLWLATAVSEPAPVAAVL